MALPPPYCLSKEITMAKKKSFGAGLRSVLMSSKSETVSVGFDTSELWADTGNYALNRMMSGRFNGGLLFGRNYVYFGSSGSGKSLQAAYVSAHAQRDHGAHVVWFDVERANTGQEGTKFFQRAGIDTSDENFSYANAATLEDINDLISKTVKFMRDAQKAGDEIQPIVFVIDSWSMALTLSQWDAAQSGVMKGDQGQKAKQTGDLITKINHLVGGLPILVIGIAHIYDNQEKHPATGRPIGHKYKTTGGHKLIFAASGVLMLDKKELYSDDVEDEAVSEHYEKIKEKQLADQKKKKRIAGIISQAENLKSRVSKPFEKVAIQIPYLGGMDRYSGLYDLLMSEGVVYTPSQGWRAFTDKDGTEVKFREKEFRQHAEQAMSVADEDISGAADYVHTMEEPNDGEEGEV